MPSLEPLILLAIFVDVLIAALAWGLGLWIIGRLLH
jgi:hypothetical protein